MVTMKNKLSWLAHHGTTQSDDTERSTYNSTNYYAEELSQLRNELWERIACKEYKE